MKQIFWKGLLCFATVLSTTACSEDKDSPATGNGSIELSLDVDRSVLTAPQSRSSIQEICENLGPDDFTVRLTDTNGETQTWPYSQFNGQNVKTGTYTLEAYAGEEGREGFDSAFFLGSTEVTVKTDATTTASITASLANAAIKVVYTDAFKAYMSNYSASVRTSGSTDGIAYPADATDELFINAGAASLYVTFTTPQGKTATLKAADFTTEAKHCYTITVDVNGGEIGDATLSVAFDDTTAAEDVEIVLSDELLNAPAPTVTPVTSTFDIIAGSAPATPAKMNIMARGGLSSVKLTTTGTFLLSQNWPAEIDLMKASADELAKMTSLGLKTAGLTKNPDMMAIIDFTDVIKSLEVITGNNTTTFRVEVEDRFGKINDPAATMTVNVDAPVLEITGNEILAFGDKTLTLNVNYNGGDVSSVKFETQPDRGVWEAAEIVSVRTNAPGRAETKSYAITIKIPAASEAINVRATVGNTTTEVYTATPKEISFSVINNPADNFATHASISFASDDTDPAILPGIARFELSTDGGSTFVGATPTADGNTVKLTGLTPSTNYTAKISAAGKSATVTFTTETATQLPNAGMETWYEIPGNKAGLFLGPYYSIFYPGESETASVWGTNNPMMTKDGANYQYVKVSATKRDGSGRSGNCAALTTVGWGSGNSAIGINGACKHIDPGLLHLGASRQTRPSGYSEVTGPITTDDLDCGIAFSSRPTSLSFYYKYIPLNANDKGYAEIWVKNAAGEIIASATANLDAADSWTEATLPLTYSRGAAKGAKIYVKFLSTYSTDFLVKKEGFITPPPNLDLSDGRWHASELYIDDINLNY